MRAEALLNSRSLNDREPKHYEHLTHAYALWAANVLLAVFAPAFPLLLLRQEIRPQTAQAHSLGRWVQAGKKKKNEATEIISAEFEHKLNQ